MTMPPDGDSVLRHHETKQSEIGVKRYAHRGILDKSVKHQWRCRLYFGEYRDLPIP